jgi:hypothetical protein
MIKSIRMIAMSVLVAGLGLLVAPIARAQDSVFVTATGDVGIGTSTPTERLDVRTSASGRSVARIQSSSATGFPGIEYFDNNNLVHLYFGLDNANANTRLNSVNNYPIVILTEGTERMRVTSTGDVGIGTSTPAERLDVRSSASGRSVARIQSSSATGLPGIEYFDNNNLVHLYFGLDNANANTRLNSVNNYPIVILTEGTERMRVTSTGSVGIGTSTPASLLHVSGGDIRVSGGSFIDDGTTLNVPDFVFEPDYRLMPLDDLREFVSREKHLPNVPSAGDVKKDGLNLSQVQMRLLEKVEELTLYTLKQDEQVKALQSENAKLNARLQALEQAIATEQQ